MENGKKTYKDMNIPNPTIRDSFIPKIRDIDKEKSRTTFYKVDSPFALQKTIEIQVTNGKGYLEDSFEPKNISKEELNTYYSMQGLKEQINLGEYLKGEMFQLFYKLIDQEKNLSFYHKNAITFQGMSREDIKDKKILLNGADNTYTIFEEDLASKEDVNEIGSKLDDVKIGVEELINERNYYESLSEEYTSQLSKQKKEVLKLKKKLEKKNSKGLIAKLFSF
jgi:hypothetical protein